MYTGERPFCTDLTCLINSYKLNKKKHENMKGMYRILIGWELCKKG